MNMRVIVILVLSAFTLCGNAQVKEVNFLGKSWYLHGYDFKIKGRSYSENFYKNLSANSAFPSEAYKTVIDAAFSYKHRDLTKELNTISCGVVFRPFYQTRVKFIKQFEFSHNIELERLNAKAIANQSSFHGAYLLFRTFSLGYNPRFIISSPTFAESLKIYFSSDGYAFLPISTTIYNQIDESYLINETKGYKKGNSYFVDRLGSDHFKFGGGLSAGIKMNLSCNWNFHAEVYTFDAFARHKNSSSITKSRTLGVTAGLRYKFGIPTDEEDGSDEKSNVFW